MLIFDDKRVLSHSKLYHLEKYYITILASLLKKSMLYVMYWRIKNEKQIKLNVVGFCRGPKYPLQRISIALRIRCKPIAIVKSNKLPLDALEVILTSYTSLLTFKPFFSLTKLKRTLLFTVNTFT